MTFADLISRLCMRMRARNRRIVSASPVQETQKQYIHISGTKIDLICFAEAASTRRCELLHRRQTRCRKTASYRKYRHRLLPRVGRAEPTSDLCWGIVVFLFPMSGKSWSSCDSDAYARCSSSNSSSRCRCRSHISRCANETWLAPPGCAIRRCGLQHLTRYLSCSSKPPRNHVARCHAARFARR